MVWRSMCPWPAKSEARAQLTALQVVSEVGVEAFEHGQDLAIPCPPLLSGPTHRRVEQRTRSQAPGFPGVMTHPRQPSTLSCSDRSLRRF